MKLLEEKRIFYIEDDRINREIVKTAVEAHGAKFDFDAWGFPEITVTKLRRFQPDIILLDLMFLHNTSGYDVYKEIRKSGVSNVPVVIVSASDATIEIPKAKNLGLNGYIPKPVNVMIFAEQLLKILDGQELWLAE